MDWLAVSIGIGLLVSLLFTEWFGLTVGGMIVPGYLALSFDTPLTILATLIAAIATWAVVRLIDRWAILFGRRRVVLTIIVGFAIGSLLRSAFASIAVATTTNVTASASIAFANEPTGLMAGVTVIGFVIPGLIALWIERTGILETLSPMMVASCLVRLVLVALGMEHYS